MRPPLITFEGIDGSGKTTQMGRLSERLKALGRPFMTTREPGATDIGRQIRQILLDPKNRAMRPDVELLLYMADRIQHLEEQIRPALEKGQLVLCDRYHDATLAYQGGGRGLDLGWLKPLEAKLVKPLRTYFIRIDPEESRSRLDRRNRDQGMDNCRLEEEDLAFFRAVDRGYQQLALAEPQRFCIIDGLGELEAIECLIWNDLEPRLEAL